MTTLIKHATVLHLTQPNGPLNRVRFSRIPDDVTDQVDALWLPQDTWVEMGRPETVTVTTVPGDTLNVDV